MMFSDKLEHEKLLALVAVLALLSFWDITAPAEAAESCATTSADEEDAKSGRSLMNCEDQKSNARSRCVTYWVSQRDNKPTSRLLTDWIGRGDRKSGRLVTECTSVK